MNPRTVYNPSVYIENDLYPAYIQHFKTIDRINIAQYNAFELYLPKLMKIPARSEKNMFIPTL